MKNMKKQYGKEKGEKVFYASANKGTIKGVHGEDIDKYATPEEKEFLLEYGRVVDAYENGECPDCGEPIPRKTKEGDECENCGHVFWLEREND